MGKEEEHDSKSSGLYPPLIITNPESRYNRLNRLWQGIPGVERAENGRLWATWYSGGKGEEPGNYVVLATSGDDGFSWNDPVLVVDPGPSRRTFDPCLWRDPDGRLWLFWAQVGEEQYFDGRAGVWSIHTDDATVEHPIWSEPRRLCHGVMMNKPIVLTNGDWLLPAAVWHRDGKFAATTEIEALRGTGIIATEDKGESFTWRGLLRNVPCRSFDEHMLIERRNGSLWMLIRTLYGIAESESTDGGQTWTRAKAAQIEGPSSRFFIRRLQSGALLLVNHDGFGGPYEPIRRSHLTAMISDDDGRTWLDKRLLLDERSGVSYPDGIQADDGRIFIIYDHNRGCNGAEDAEREILIAVFTEDDVRAGKSIGSKTRLKQTVSSIPIPAPGH